ncbi:hypothetical protein C4K06_4676 [Pseudomonas chlororaphis subsp. aureofaciens]|uniref:hypothetical protein n=1 Tax=Pseudomonas chlororaphis TaxID=587753 RepID=UPI000F56CC4B|nr:hypothetical protein [Pseudomonas chlororaphis]AZE37691.1 hypothetical protein C4K06_4676 [Pseudomonas chlororaphis subsp. aureofaciens]
MATKTSKRVGETSTTVSVGVRIDPKVKFALDIMGRLQKRSLTAVIEWAISNAISQQAIDKSTYSMGELLDKIWSTDESTRLVMLAFYLPQALTYDELRLWETIQASGYFWHKYPDGTYDENNLDMLDFSAVRSGWSSLTDHVEKHKGNSCIMPIYERQIVPF